MREVNVDEVLFGKQDIELTKGKKTNKVKDTTKCPICGCKSFVLVKGNLNHFFCGTVIKIKDNGTNGVCGELVNKCRYNMFNFYHEDNYNPAIHYDNGYLENLDIDITGCCMYHSYPIPLDLDGTHIKIYKKGKYLNLKGGTLVGSALCRKKSTEVQKAVEQYVQDYNDIVVDNNIWSWTITDNKGHYIDSLMGFYGNVYEQAKEYISAYGIYEEDYDKFWARRQK